MSDADSLSEEVNTETVAVQFTLTDVGTLWADFGVCQQITHHGQRLKHFERVGVKLTQSFADAKGLTVQGRPQAQGAAQQEERKRETHEERLMHEAELCMELAEKEKPKGGGKGGGKKQ